MMMQELLGIPIKEQTKKEVLEKIIKVIREKPSFYHIISLNPENLVLTQKNSVFKQVVLKANLRIVDGIGIVIAGRLLGFNVGERYPGVDLMHDLLELAVKIRLRVLLIGGKEKLADKIANCYNTRSGNLNFKGLVGIKNIKKLNKDEEDKIFSIVADFKPNLVFVAFGSPAQELWIERHKDKFTHCVCMGVGGGFDFISGNIPRAPWWVRRMGFEWLYRLLKQPWRFRRQLELIRFLILVCRQKIDLWRKR